MQHPDIRPFHVGVIMDGNGRWAAARGLARIKGHARGARRVSEIVRACPDLGVTHLTLYAFSTENWRRPLAEIEGLMRIFGQYILGKMTDLRARDVRVRFLGMRHRVPERLRALMALLEDETRGCRGLNLSIAIDYGGRDEIARAARTLCAEVAAGRLAPGAIGAESIARALDTRELPDPDFIIRTSGERRVSNFLLWQGIYAEYAFPEAAWPEFGVAGFTEAVEAFRLRQRRYGAVAPLALGVTRG
jgi:undecaprenyl diphosphate synthase